LEARLTMKKINMTIGALLVGSLYVAANFAACNGGGSQTGAAGSSAAGSSATGAAGTTCTGAAGTSATGAAGTSSNTDAGAMSATQPDGKCVTNAYPREGGICMCQPSTPNVCGDRCTDTKTDNANCGMCGKACPATSTCNNGTCGPEATTVVPAAPGCMSMQIAVGNGNIYWTDLGHKTVKYAPVSGCGAVTTITDATATGPTLITLRGTTLFWLDGMVIKKSVGGAAAEVVYTSPTKINGLTVSADGMKVYFSTGVTVKQVMTATTAIDVALEEHEGVPGALALDPNGTTMVYPTDLNGDVDIVYLKDGMVAKCGKEDPANPGMYLMVNCTRIARSQGSLFKEAVVAVAGKVYWVDGTSVKGGDSAPGAAASNDTYGSTLENNITALTANATTIYFAEAKSDGTEGIIEKTAMVKDSTPVQLARGQKGPNSIATDATKVYWSTSDCSINATGL
jgi:hypothetical protein